MITGELNKMKSRFIGILQIEYLRSGKIQLITETLRLNNKLIQIRTKTQYKDQEIKIKSYSLVPKLKPEIF